MASNKAGDARQKNEEHIKELFQTIDKNKNGKISREELRIGFSCMCGYNPSKKVMNDIMTEMGVNDGQEVDFTKFRACLLTYFERASEKTNKEKEIKDLEKAFKRFDKDGSGTFDKIELKAMLTSFGEKVLDKDIDNLFDLADVNRDGRLHYKEFIKIFVKDME